MDVLSDVLNSVRLSGSVLFTARFTVPFSVATPDSENFAEMLVPNARRLILFHIITEGRCTAITADGKAVEAEAGDMLLLPYGAALTIGNPQATSPCSIFELVPPLPWTGPPEVSWGGGGPPLRLLCGFLHADELLLQPLLADLPALLVIRGGDAMPRLRNLQAFVVDEMQAGRAGGATVIRRLVELLFVESLRHALTSRFDGPAPPLTALGDPIVGRALMLLHGEPAHDWTVEMLAKQAATSRSVLSDRFAAMIGCPPMEYLARWRMQLAARRMLDRPEPLAEIAAGVGYLSENGFNRTFRRYFGEPPGRWRKLHKPIATPSAQ